MKNPDRRGDLEEIFEILVTSYGQKGGTIPLEGDLCWRPATDVYETESEFVVQMDLAGMDADQIEVVCDAESPDGARDPSRPHGPRQAPLPQDGDQRGPVRPAHPDHRRRSIPRPREARYQSGFLTVTFKKGGRRATQRRQISVDQ